MGELQLDAAAGEAGRSASDGAGPRERTTAPFLSPEKWKQADEISTRLPSLPPRGSKRPGSLPPDEVALIDAFNAHESQRIAHFDRTIKRLESERAASLVRTMRIYEWANPASGYGSFAKQRAAVTREGDGAADLEVKSALALDIRPDAKAAIAEGTVTLKHIGIIVRASERAVRGGGRPVSDEERAALLRAAKGSTADVFTKNVNRWIAGRDPVAHDAAHAESHRRRFLVLSTRPNGTHITGFLDPIAGATLRQAIEAAIATPSADDTRTSEQRYADGLVTLASKAMDVKLLKGGALVRPHVSLIMTEETFASATTELRRRKRLARATAAAIAQCPHTGDRGEGRGGAEGALGPCQCWREAPAVVRDAAPESIAPATLEDGTPIPLTELTRLMCDVEITRIALNALGAPLDVGQTERSFSGELRRAVIARDQGCRFAGCTAQARWCEIHHIEWWSKGGKTDLHNGVLVCRFHHGLIHKGILAVTKDACGQPTLTHLVPVRPSPRSSTTPICNDPGGCVSLESTPTI